MRYRPWRKPTAARPPGSRYRDAIVDALDDRLAVTAGRRAGVPARRARDPRSGRSPAQAPLRAAPRILPLFARQSRRRAGSASSPAPGPPRGAGDQRRRDLADGAGHPLRGRHRAGARINRYSHRNKVEQLQVEPIAQSAAKQRAGRCGRVASGVCFRLYAEDDFAKRPAHTDPEILRASLAGVILRMKALKLGEVETSPSSTAAAAHDGRRLPAAQRAGRGR
jgi:ATP-dependent helicase HrpA